MTDWPDLDPAFLANADQQVTVAGGMLDKVVADTRAMLAEHDETVVWVRLGINLAKAMGLTSDKQKLAAHVLAAAVIRLAKENQ